MSIVHWDKTQNLLFINSSDNSSLHERLANKIGESASIIKGDAVFRCFQGINRLILQNVGLTKILSGPLRYIMYTGYDVGDGLTQAHRRNTVKANMFGAGYENGMSTTVGASYKGRIWSRKTTTVSGFCQWCSLVGKKVLDESIDVDKILAGVLKPIIVNSRPDLMPITIEWPDIILREQNRLINIGFGDEFIPLHEVSIDLVNPSVSKPFCFTIHSYSTSAEFELTIFEEPEGKGFKYRALNYTPITVKIGAKQRLITEWFSEHPPVIRFTDGSCIENNIHIKVDNQSYPPYNREIIDAWSWLNVDLKKESQGQTKDTDSIQYHVIQQLKQKNYQIIFDDDNSGEAADIVTFKVRNNKIFIELFHCKYAVTGLPAARIDDLYVVCGQAQKSVHWKESIHKLIKHMQRRESRRVTNGGVSRFEVGNQHELQAIDNMTKLFPFSIKIYIVQPGLSKSKASPEQLQLLGATELYLEQTYSIKLGIISSS